MGDINHTLDTAGMAQKTSATCRLACYKMLLKKDGADHSESTIRTKLKVFNISYDDAYANGLHSKHWSLAAFALGFAPLLSSSAATTSHAWASPAAPRPRSTE
jgi:hypothetical protein